MPSWRWPVQRSSTRTPSQGASSVAVASERLWKQEQIASAQHVDVEGGEHATKYMFVWTDWTTRTVVQSLRRKIYFLPLKVQQIYLRVKMGMGRPLYLGNIALDGVRPKMLSNVWVYVLLTVNIMKKWVWVNENRKIVILADISQTKFLKFCSNKRWYKYIL